MHRNKWKLKHNNPKPMGFSKLATHSSNLAWRIPRKKKPGRLQSMRLQSQAWLSNYHSVKAVLQGRFIAIQIYLKKQERNQINNLTLHLKQLDKEEIKNPRVSRRKFSSVQSLSRVRLFATPWIAAHQASVSITSSWSLLKLMPIGSVMPSSHLILCHPLLFLRPIPPSIRVFSNESTLPMRWPMYWSFNVLEHQFFQRTLRTYLRHDGLVGFPCSPRDSQESSPTPQFKSIKFSALSFLHSPTWPLEKP